MAVAVAGTRFRVLGGVGRCAREKAAAVVVVEEHVLEEQLTACPVPVGEVGPRAPMLGPMVGLAIPSLGAAELGVEQPPLNVLIRLGGCESGEYTRGARLRTIESPWPSRSSPPAVGWLWPADGNGRRLLECSKDTSEMDKGTGVSEFESPA